MTDAMEEDDGILEGPSGRTEDFSLMAGLSGNNKAAQRAVRSSAEYEDTGQRFRIDKKSFTNQYAQIYFCRLQKMVPEMRQRVSKSWPGTEFSSVLDMPEGKEVAVVGTLYKEMKLKPSILSEYTKEGALEQLIGRTKFAEENDTMVLEDESARIQLRGAALPVGDLVTGIVIALKGSAVPGGDFWVTDVLYPGMGAQTLLPKAAPEPRYLALVSGLAVGDERADPLRLSLLLDFLSGMLGSSAEQATASQIVRTIVAGGLMHGSEHLAAATTHSKPRQQNAALAPIREADMVLTQLAGAMPVDVMPGASDPASHSLPQQPLHHCLFPGAAAFPTLCRVTNPHEFRLGGLTLLGTSGQNVDDVYKYSSQEERLNIMEAILDWGHLAPTAPDTLSVYPFTDDDPFLLRDAPHVFFAGNQPEFSTRMVTGPEGQRVRLIAVPKFAESGTLVLLNLATMDVHPIQFDTLLGA